MNTFRIPLVYGILIVIIKVISIDYSVCNGCSQYVNYRSIIFMACAINLLIVIFKGLRVRASLTENDFNATEYSSNLFKVFCTSLFFSVLSMCILGSYLLWLNAQDDLIIQDSNIVLFATAFFIYILSHTLLHPVRLLMIHVGRRIR